MHPGPLPAAEEQPAAGGRPRRRQDRDRRGAGAQDRRRRDAGGAGGDDDLLARHGGAAGGHAVSRRLRGAAEGRDEGAREPPERDPLHRRDPYGDRRRRDQRRGDGCVEPAEAGVAVGDAALHGVDDLQGVPPALREGPGAGAAVPEDRRERADDRGRVQDPQGAEALLRGPSRRALHRRRDPLGGGSVGAVHP